MLKEFKKIQAFFFIISAVSGLTLYIHNTFATSESVFSIRKEIHSVSHLVCHIAIELKLNTAMKYCIPHDHRK